MGENESADVVVLTAIKLEYEAVLQVDAGAVPGSSWAVRLEHGLPVASRAFSGRDGRPLRITVARAPDMGIALALSVLIPLVDRLKPRCIAMSGVCAGRPEKTGLGDVIAAERIFFHDTGKQIGKQRGKKIEQDLRTYNLRDDWKVAIEDTDFSARFREQPWWMKRPIPLEWQEAWVLDRLQAGIHDPSSEVECAECCPQWAQVIDALWKAKAVRAGTLELTEHGRARIQPIRIKHRGLPDVSPTGALLPFKVHVAALGSGNKVVEDEAVWGQISTHMRKVLGLDMEAAALGALAQARAHHQPRLDALVMKGVMDFANHGRDDHFKEYAARASAESLFAVLRDLLPEATSATLDAGNSPRATRIGGRSRLYTLPARPPSMAFTGREVDVAVVERLLAPGAHVRVAASLEGLAGVGKTELALQVVHNLAREKRFPGGIFWLDAKQLDLRQQWGGPIADQLGVGPGDVDERVRAVIHMVENGDDVLIVLDNVAHWTSTVMPAPIPKGVNVALLVTTQVRGLGGSDFEAHEVSVLKSDTARSLMLTLIGSERAAEDGMVELLDFLGGHPLAICLAGAYLKTYSDRDARGYLDMLVRGEPIEEAVKDLPRYEATVKAALTAATDRISDNDRNALLVATWFADADASVELLRAAGVRPDSERALRDLHLIAVENGRWSMHRLVRHHARQGVDETGLRLSREAFWGACLSFIAKDATRVSAYRRDRVHLVAFAERAMDNGGLPTPVALSALQHVGGAALAAGDLATARRCFEARTELWQRVVLDQREAFTKIEAVQIMPDGTRVPMMDPFVVTEMQHARARIEEAWAHLQAGRCAEALAEADSALELLKQHLPLHDGFVQLGMEARIESLVLLGRLPQAKSDARKLHQAVTEQHGADSIQACSAGLYLAKALHTDGPRALAAVERALKAAAAQSPEAQTIRAGLLAHRGYILDRQGLYNDARVSLAQAAVLYAAALGPADTSAVRAEVNVIVLATKAGNIAAARRLLGTVEARVAALPDEHPIAICYRGLEAEILSAEGDHNAALHAAAVVEAAVANLPNNNSLRRSIESDVSKVREAAKSAKQTP